MIFLKKSHVLCTCTESVNLMYGKLMLQYVIGSIMLGRKR